MFVFQKAAKDKGDAQEASVNITIAKTAAAMFLYFAALRLAYVIILLVHRQSACIVIYTCLACSPVIITKARGY